MKKVIVITGASSGLGKEIAKVYLQQKKYILILTGRNALGLKEFQNITDITCVVGDITKKETLEQITRLVKQEGRVDILINNAGIIYIKPFLENTSDELDTILDIDLKAPMLLTQALYPIMVEQQSGHIININSTAGLEGKLNHTLYNAAKFGLTGFTNALRLEAKNHNIRVTSFHPGGMNTNFYDEITGVPVEKFMDAKKIAQLVVKLSETDSSLAPDEVVVNRMTK